MQGRASSLDLKNLSKTKWKKCLASPPGSSFEWVTVKSVYLASHVKSPGFSFQPLPVVTPLPAGLSHPSLPGISSP